MRFACDSFETNSIRSYGEGRIMVNEHVISRSVILTPGEVIYDWPPQSFEELEREHIAQLGRLQPEIVILGTGASLRFPPPAHTGSLLKQGIGIEVMDTAAACRTFNILLSEERRVVAALLMI